MSAVPSLTSTEIPAKAAMALICEEQGNEDGASDCLQKVWRNNARAFSQRLKLYIKFRRTFLRCVVSLGRGRAAVEGEEKKEK